MNDLLPNSFIKKPIMLNRRDLIKLSGAAAAASLLPGIIKAAVTHSKGPFSFCLNTSTISGQNPGLLHTIEIAAKAGYDGIELWINDIKEYLKQGNSIQSLAHLFQQRVS